MMKKIITVSLAVLLCSTWGIAASQKKTAAPLKGYAIEVQITGAKQDALVRLHHYVNAESVAFDSLQLDAGGKVVFKGGQPLDAGMYSLKVENSNIDFFITAGVPQQFSITFDTSQGLPSLVVKGSPENEGFADYMHFISSIRQHAQRLQERMQLYRQNPDSAYSITSQMQQLNQQVKDRINAIWENFPNTTLSFFFHSMQEPEAPEPNISPMSPNPDSLRQAYFMNFYKERFFDNVDFSDARILRLPVLTNLFTTYFSQVLPPEKEVLQAQVDFLIGKTKVNREVYEFAVRNLYDFFRHAPYPEIEPIALYIADKYVVQDAGAWTDEAYVSKLREAARLDKLNPFGTIATNLKLQDPNGQFIALHDVQAPYTVLYFFNPLCGTCAVVTPILWETYREYRNKGLQVYAVYVDKTKSDWLPYITEKNQFDWINVWSPDETENIYAKYDIHAIPTIYLLDNEKKIILKDALIDQLKATLSTLLP
ncbi:MAG: redoxin domain-containing protein [Prevotellaceae bacterium]|jgi:thiol-disulfide isomerase/thioredoxin|nr:redoxin domain-containing protein [Prevotellaceae bacterium]